MEQVKTTARIVEGDPGKVICREADRLKPAAVVMGTRGRGIIQRLVLSPILSFLPSFFPSVICVYFHFFLL